MHALSQVRLVNGSVQDWVNHFKAFYTTTRELLALAGRDAFFLYASLAGTLVQVPVALAAAAVWPWLTAAMDSGGDFWAVCPLMFKLTVLLAVINYTKNRLKEIFFGRLMEHIQVAAVEKLLSEDAAYWDRNDPSQQVVWVFQQAGRVNGFLGSLETLVSCLCSLGGGVIQLYILSPKVTVCALAITSSMGLYFVWLNGILARMGAVVDVANSELQAGVLESFMNIRTVQAFAGEGVELFKFGVMKGFWWHCKLRLRLASAINHASTLAFEWCRPLAINFAGFLLVQSGKIQGGAVLIIQGMLTEFLVGSFDTLVQVLRGISAELMIAQLFMHALKQVPDIPAGVGKEPEGPVKGELAFRKVHFSYPTRMDDEVLHGISFSVPAGSFTAIVGRSGSGKTTIGRLLQRFYDVRAGTVTLDGHVLRELKPQWLRQHIGYVEQEPKLFQGTIRDNIRYGKSEASEKEVERVAELARVSKFTSLMPEGLDTDVGQFGSSLSGGQKQRVAIARAMLKNAPVLLMDEATSALDTETERLLQEALENVMAGRTTVVIAHRLTTVRKADQIVVMDQGSIVETGTHDALCEKRGAYARLMHHQQRNAPEDSSEAPAQEPNGQGPSEAPAQEPNGQGPPAKEEQQAQAVEPEPAAEEPPQLPEQPQPEPPQHDPQEEKGLPMADEFEALLGKHREQQHASLPTDAKAAAPPSVDRASELPAGLSLAELGFWTLRLMGRNKWILAVSVVISLMESRTKQLVGPRFGQASASFDDPAVYYPAFWLYFSANVQSAIYNFLKDRLKEVVMDRLEERLQLISLTVLQRQDTAFYEKHEAGSLTPWLFEKIGRSMIALMLVTDTMLHSATGSIMGICMLVSLSPPVTFWTLAMILPAMLFFLFVGRIAGERSAACQKADADLYSVAIESLMNIRTVHSFVGEKLETRKFLERKAVWWEAEQARRRPGWLLEAVTLLIMNNLVFALLVVINHYHSGRKSSVAVSLMYMISVFCKEFGAFTLSVSSVGEQVVAMRTLGETLTEVPGINPDLGEAPADRPKGVVSFRDVDFSYRSSPDKLVLRRVSFEVPAGSFTAVVGRSGAGKTTLGLLMLRFYDPQGGHVLLDGRPLDSLRPQWLRQQIGYVEQEPKLFRGSIRDNIRYGKPLATDAELMLAAETASVMDFASGLPAGLDTEVGKAGAALSGGQKQRVAIARTVLKDPPVLLLDEATSALDSHTEHQLQEALGRVMARRTSIIIAHRMSTVARATQVIVMEAGSVAQVGSHAELEAQGGLYGQLMPTFVRPRDAPAAGPAEAPEPADGAEGGGEEDGGLRRRK